MKRVISLLLAIGMVFGFALFMPSTSYADDAAAGAEAEAPGFPADPAQLDPEVKAAFGIGDRNWIENPQKKSEYLNNFFLAYCAGDWDYFTDPDELDITKISWSSGLKPWCNLYNALLGAFTNQNGFYAVCMDGKYYIVTQGVEPSLSKEKLMEHQKEVYNKAVSIRNEMIKSGKIKDNMTEKEKCGAYYKLLSSWNVQPSNPDKKSQDPAYRTVYMKYDTAYACLVKKVADCSGKSAGFSLLMNMEDVKSYGVCGQMKGTDSGHILNYFVLDGEEFLSDFGNHIKTDYIDSESIQKRFTPDAEYLTAAKREAGIDPTADINDYLDIRSIRDNGQSVSVTCAVSEDYAGDEKADYRVNYGIIGNCMYNPGFSLRDLKEGVTIDYPRDEIERHTIPPVVFISVE